jgi:hypothetical protein
MPRAAVFFTLGLLLPIESLYAAFSLPRTAHGALVVFGLWFGLVSFPRTLRPKREPGENPGLPRSGQRERRPRCALAFGLGSGGR